MSELKTDYKDDILDETVNTNRTFNVRDNQGNLLYQDVQLEETTVFEQEGDSFGARDVNETNTHLVADDGNGNKLDFQFSTDGVDYGYLDLLGNFVPFKTKHTETATPDSRALYDMGVNHKNRYVDLSNVPNANSTTYTYPANSTGGTVDLGESNIFRYVNAANVYAKGKADGGMSYVDSNGQITGAISWNFGGYRLVVVVVWSNSWGNASVSTNMTNTFNAYYGSTPVLHVYVGGANSYFYMSGSVSDKGAVFVRYN